MKYITLVIFCFGILTQCRTVEVAAPTYFPPPEPPKKYIKPKKEEPKVEIKEEPKVVEIIKEPKKEEPKIIELMREDLHKASALVESLIKKKTPEETEITLNKKPEEHNLVKGPEIIEPSSTEVKIPEKLPETKETAPLVITAPPKKNSDIDITKKLVEDCEKVLDLAKQINPENINNIKIVYLNQEIDCIKLLKDDKENINPIPIIQNKTAVR
jgi:hypothetical protein